MLLEGVSFIFVTLDLVLFLGIILTGGGFGFSGIFLESEVLFFTDR